MYESHYLWIMYFFIKNEVLIRERKKKHWERKKIRIRTIATITILRTIII